MHPESPLSPEVARLVRAVRFALVCLVVALSYFAIRATSAIIDFRGIFRDMLNGKPLPPLTVFVIQARYGLVVCAWSVPLAAVGTLFTRRFVASFYLIGGLCLLTIALFLIIYEALSAPLFMIIQQMQGS